MLLVQDEESEGLLDKAGEQSSLWKIFTKIEVCVVQVRQRYGKANATNVIFCL